MSELVPVRIDKLDSRELVIEWSDGVVQQMSFRALRDGCQCATCNDKRMKQVDDNDREDGSTEHHGGTDPVLICRGSLRHRPERYCTNGFSTGQ